MSKYQLKIKLMSDLCVSDGGVYNSSLDTDICYDRYGFPYIPAKRIKGCLRECALELQDWGMDIPIEKLFGEEGSDSNRAKIRIGDAILDSYDAMEKQVEKYTGNLIFHPQNVLDHFSYIRTQTSIDYETGVADPTSLRTMRVVKKNLGDNPTVFVSEVEIDDSLDDEVVREFRDCCETLTNMGIARTRGLGEVQTTLCKISNGAEEQSEKEVSRHADYIPNSTKLFYELRLEEPMICKSTSGGESRSLDYIEGSKILGLIIDELKSQGKDFLNFMNSGKLFCSNAYLMQDGERCTEVPANYYAIKNDHEFYVEKVDADKTPEYPDDEQLEEENQGKQLNQPNMMKHCYIRKNDKGELIRADVDMEERYHHSRPEDKSVGRANPKMGESRFYQISSIEANQKFAGFITGTEEQIKIAYDCLSHLDIVYLGYSHSSEYGKTQIKITGLQKERPAKEITAQRLIVKLEAPVLIYNDQAFYSTRVEDLNKEIQAILEFPDDSVEEIDRYVNYTTVGGYNVTWDKRKPMTEVFDKGTVLIYHFRSPVTMIVPDQILIGERFTEGFGEVSITYDQEDNSKTREGEIVKYADSKGENRTESTVFITSGSLAEELCQDLFLDFVRSQSIEDAKEYAKMKEWDDENIKEIETARPTVSNMILMCQNSDSIDSIKTTVNNRYGQPPDKNKDERSNQKKNKEELANNILTQVEHNYKSLPDKFSEKYNVINYTGDKDFYSYEYLKTFLQQLKYIFRATDKRNNKKWEGAQ